MKRTYSLLLFAILVFILCACGQQTAETVTVSAAPAAAPTQETAAAGQEASPAETAAAGTEETADGPASPVVFFTADISPEGLQAVYEALGWQPSSGSVNKPK